MFSPSFRNEFAPPEILEKQAALDCVAIMSGLDVEAIRMAAEDNVREGRFVLTGTTALIIRGYRFETNDVDFLCSHCPGGDGDSTGSGGSHSVIYVVQRDDGMVIPRRSLKVDFIYADSSRIPFLTSCPDVICGIPVADVKDVLAFKLFANREKDRKFLAEFKERYGDP